VENYFNYFTEIEERFQLRWGGILRLSPLDWALIEVWKDAGIPLEAVLQGIDTTFEHYEKRPLRRKVNGLGFCAQEVLSAAEGMKEAAVGSASQEENKKPETGFPTSEIVAFLNRNASQLGTATLPEGSGISGRMLAAETAGTLHKLAAEINTAKSPPRLEDLERRLAVLEEKLFAVLMAITPDEQIVEVRREADRELSPYRSKMPTAQIQQLQKQYLNKKLLEKYKLPRLSLFYM
jgi:hypothetical protein